MYREPLAEVLDESDIDLLFSNIESIEKISQLILVSLGVMDVVMSYEMIVSAFEDFVFFFEVF